jgi:hypothetical protein
MEQLPNFHFIALKPTVKNIMLQNCNFSYLRSYSKQNYKLDEDAVSN